MQRIVLMGRSVIQRSAFNARRERGSERAILRNNSARALSNPPACHRRRARCSGQRSCRRSRFLAELFITSQMGLESTRLVLGLKVNYSSKKLLFLRIYVSRNNTVPYLHNVWGSAISSLRWHLR